MLLARFLELNFEIKEVNIPNDEQFNEDFAKLNPAKKIPVLVDGDYVLSESRAILAYLVNSRKPGSNLYPSDPKERGIVDQRLYYDATVFLPNMLAVIVS
jgi:glutathione S-transferase